MAISSQEFRDVCARIPAGVCVITTATPQGQPVGITISSLVSLSVNPPQVLFCLSRKSGTLPFFEKSCHFVVHLLSSEQTRLADGFANIVPIDWNDVDYEQWGENKLPHIKGCAASLLCHVSHTLDGGDHAIIIGGVEDIGGSWDESALLRYQRQYMPIICQ